jgi:hypothetical protein
MQNVGIDPSGELNRQKEVSVINTVLFEGELRRPMPLKQIEIGQLDAPSLSDIYNRCASELQNDPVHKFPIFGLHVNLSEADITQLRRLSFAAEDKLRTFLSDDGFRSLVFQLAMELESMRKTYGTLGEESRLNSNSSTEVKRESINAISLPENVFNYYYWSNKLYSLRGYIKEYRVDADGKLTGLLLHRTARGLGKDIKDLRVLIGI